MNKNFMTQRILYILILVFLYFNKAICSFKIIDVNDLPEPNLVQDFITDDNIAEFNIKIPVANIADEDYSIKSNRFQHNNQMINENGNPKLWKVFKKGNHENNYNRNKLLVKRIVPHGIAATGIEYDHKFNTAYKPLIRIHKTKSINQLFNDMKSKKYNDYKNEDSSNEIILVSPKDGEYKIFKPKYDLNDEDLLEPFQKSKEDFDHKHKRLDFVGQIQRNIKDIRSAESFKSFERNKKSNFKDKRLELVKQIQKNIKGIKSESKRLNAYAKVINALNNVLRISQFERSSEAHDHEAFDEDKMHEDHDEKEKPKKWIPYYPPWNYWTYKKTIHEDVCPGAQVKVGNMCVWRPPH